MQTSSNPPLNRQNETEMPSIWQCFTWRHFGIDSLDFQRSFWTRVDATNLGNLPAFRRNACPPFQRCGLGDGLRGWFDMYWHVNTHVIHVMPHHGFARSIAKPALRSATSGIPVLPVSRFGGTWWDMVGPRCTSFLEKRKPKIATTSHKWWISGTGWTATGSITAPPSCLSLSQGDESPAGTNDLGYPLGIEHGWEVSYGIFEGKYGTWSN